MKFYVLKLLPPRPTFIQDMTPTEREAMSAHAIYLKSRMVEGKILFYGPVLDPAGPYGIAIASLRDDEDPSSIAKDDPVIKAGLGLAYHISPMAAAVTRDSLG